MHATPFFYAMGRNMKGGIQQSYDEVPYVGLPFLHSHPDNLSTIATLFGMQPPAVEVARVLELGCGTGGNLIPMALTLPGARFVGIDLSPRQIDMAQNVVQSLGLTNIEFQARDLMEIGAELGNFDYVIAHGIYSWVPAPVQERILQLCKELLSPHGVAYISYNTYPGWHARGMVRDMLNYHVRNIDDPAARAREARSFLQFLATSVQNPKSPYAYLLLEEQQTLAKQGDHYLLHEHLELENHPLYFHEFAARAATMGLQFIGEAEFGDLAGHLKPEVRTVLERYSADLIEREQYLDFLRDRTFRKTLLCHADVPLQRVLRPNLVESLNVTALAKPLSARPDCASSATEGFENPNGAKLSTNDPLVKTALVELYRLWPGSLRLEELHGIVLERLAECPVPVHRDPAHLAGALLQCYLSSLVEFHVVVPKIALRAGPRPVGSPLARLQCEMPGHVTNLRHYNVSLADLDRFILRLLDGSRDLAELTSLLDRSLSTGEVARPEELATATSEELLNGSLARLARSALLLA